MKNKSTGLISINKQIYKKEFILRNYKEKINKSYDHFKKKIHSDTSNIMLTQKTPLKDNKRYSEEIKKTKKIPGNFNKRMLSSTFKKLSKNEETKLKKPKIVNTNYKKLSLNIV